MDAQKNLIPRFWLPDVCIPLPHINVNKDYLNSKTTKVGLNYSFFLLTWDFSEQRTNGKKNEKNEPNRI